MATRTRTHDPRLGLFHDASRPLAWLCRTGSKVYSIRGQRAREDSLSKQPESEEALGPCLAAELWRGEKKHSNFSGCLLYHDQELQDIQLLLCFDFEFLGTGKNDSSIEETKGLERSHSSPYLQIGTFPVRMVGLLTNIPRNELCVRTFSMTYVISYQLGKGGKHPEHHGLVVHQLHHHLWLSH